MKITHSQECELNLAPIIDCFTVLITFLLVSASYLSIGIFDAGISAAGETASPSQNTEDYVQVELQASHGIEVKLMGKQSKFFKIEQKDGNWNFEKLLEELHSIKSKGPISDSIILSATSDIEYVHIIQCMEKLKQFTKNITLGGF